MKAAELWEHPGKVREQYSFTGAYEIVVRLKYARTINLLSGQFSHDAVAQGVKSRIDSSNLIFEIIVVFIYIISLFYQFGKIVPCQKKTLKRAPFQRTFPT